MTATFNLTGLVVSDMAATAAFYRRLGLEIAADADGLAHVEVELPGGLRLAFDTEDTIRSFDPGWKPGTGSSRMSLAFACDSPSDVDATFAELVEAGYRGHLEPWDAVWGQRYACVADPDGNPVDLYAPLPTTEG
ncbi:VOC family protein [Parafrankia sp. FMc2]|uniref:VOC family protein n=1 Tax=Parafrankia sp. FMc2 TaxID=3233196 RepID=UPI0034D75BF2